LPIILADRSRHAIVRSKYCKGPKRDLLPFHGFYFVNSIKKAMARLAHHAEIVARIVLDHQSQLHAFDILKSRDVGFSSDRISLMAECGRIRLTREPHR
jgi:hypothetical protein